MGSSISLLCWETFSEHGPEVRYFISGLNYLDLLKFPRRFGGSFRLLEDEKESWHLRTRKSTLSHGNPMYDRPSGLSRIRLWYTGNPLLDGSFLWLWDDFGWVDSSKCDLPLVGNIIALITYRLPLSQWRMSATVLYQSTLMCYY